MKAAFSRWSVLILCLAQSLTTFAAVFTSDTLIGPQNSGYDGQDIVISNATLIVDGAHHFASVRVASGATLTHSIGTNGVLLTIESANDEPQVLTDTNAVLLAHPSVFQVLVVVRDSTGTVTYSNGVDYVLGLVNSSTSLERTETSAIPDGATVLVSYLYYGGNTPAGLWLTVTNLEVEPGAIIDANGRGFGPNSGPGNGGENGSPPSGGGGTYGGTGGLSSSNAPGGPVYGSAFSPTNHGSGGGAGISGLGGGAGGGLIRIDVAQTALVNGTITAGGLGATNSRSGGGSGGSIWISAQTLSGSGVIAANGGAGEPFHGGGGGGGRIALEYSSNSFNGILSAHGGNGWQRGGAGSLFLRASGSGGEIIYDNGGLAGATTVLNLLNAGDVTVQGQAMPVVTTSIALSNLTIRSGSTLTTSQTNNATLTLVVSGNLTIEPGAQVMMKGNGFPSNQGSGLGLSTFNTAGGSGHAGYGGMGTASTFVVLGGVTYGSITAPTTLGSGGRPVSNFPGGNGGGAIRISVLRNLHLDGALIADATDASGTGSGGASGGSIWLTLGGFSGAGLVSVNGGAGGYPFGGGGGGGRIAITYQSNLFVGTLSAHGGAGSTAGGAGTVYVKANNETFGSLFVNNAGQVGTNTFLDVSSLNHLTVTNGGRVRCSLSTLALNTLNLGDGGALVTLNSTINVSSNVVIAAGGHLSGDNIAPQGSGQGSSSSTGAGGGGHGGFGGRGLGGFGGNAYGSYSGPTTTGSPGGSTFSGTVAGFGGGLVRLIVQGRLLLDGRISADGGNALTNQAGGGSGGGVFLTINKDITGAGTISANGGAGFLPNGGGGGGGRVAIVFASNTFAGPISAKGGVGFANGGAGTVYLKPLSVLLGNLVIDSGPTVGISTNTLVDLQSPAVNLNVLSGTAVVNTVTGAGVVNNLSIGSNGTLLASSVTLNVTSNATILPGGHFSLDGTSPRTSSQGQGGPSSAGSGGGGHAGAGGNGAGLDLTGRGGGAFGSASSPVNFGGTGGGFNLTGGAGGGILRLTVGGLLSIGGSLSANGQSVTTNNSGGGAGGSLWLTVGGLTGNGSISANGGAGYAPSGGGGGGGRIALYYGSNSFTGSFSARGGTGFTIGGAGTIYQKPNTNNVAMVLVDNGNQNGSNTTVSVTGGSFDLTIQNGAIVGLPGTPRDLLIRSNASLFRAGDVAVMRHMTMEPGATMALDNVSNSASPGGGTGQSGVGVGYSGSNPRGGAGHGGYGALNPPGGGGRCYGTALAPITFGSQGGNGSGTTSSPLGGYGGAAIHLTVPGTLLVNGRISVNGGDGAFNSGGGSGGSIWLTLGTLAGSGQILARGGTGDGLAGGGGGGRIAIYYGTNLFAGTISACGGVGAEEGGAGTIYLKPNSQLSGSLLVNNCGLTGTNTPLSQVFGLGSSLSVSGGAVAEMQGFIPILESLTISDAGRVTGGTSETNLYLAVTGNLMIDSDSALEVDRKGYTPRGAGPGVGGSLSNQGGGGGYGGNGGDSASGASGGTNYGSATQPVDRGSDGGFGLFSSVEGSRGGGALRLHVGGALRLDGRVTANGGEGLQDDSGGGSGGSLWITANTLTGSGSIRADGGQGELFGGGGGGGGRIALYSPMNTFTGLVSTAGGIGAFAGGTGTVHSSSALLPFSILSHSPTAVVSNVVTQLILEFNAPVNPLTVQAADFSIQTPYGFLPPNDLVFSYPGPATLRVSFPPQNVNGTYQFQVGPNLADFLGEPLSQVYTGAFSVALQTINGRVTDINGQPVAGVALQPLDGLLPAYTDANGFYALGVPPGWNGTVQPMLGNSMFAPGARTYVTLQSGATNQDYVQVTTIAPQLQGVSGGGQFGVGWYGISGVLYQPYWSTNLVQWYLLGAPIVGTNGPAGLLIPLDNEPSKFFRVQAQN